MSTILPPSPSANFTALQFFSTRSFTPIFQPWQVIPCPINWRGGQNRRPEDTKPVQEARQSLKSEWPYKVTKRLKKVFSNTFVIFQTAVHCNNNGIRNIMEDQYLQSIILKSYLARKRRLADGDTKRKLADTQTDWFVYDTLSVNTGPLDLGIRIF